jgi:hypothetical protein
MWYARFRQWRLARHMGFLCSRVGLLDLPAVSRPADEAELFPFDRTCHASPAGLLPAAFSCVACG